MDYSTFFLARVLGLYLVIVGGAALFFPDRARKLAALVSERVVAIAVVCGMPVGVYLVWARAAG